MSKMVKEVKEVREVETKKEVTNFMGGISYEVNPLDTLKLVTASSIFGEPQYYREGEYAQKGVHDGVFGINRDFADYALSCLDKYSGMSTSALMEKVIDDALMYDFKATLEWAVTLRNEYLMRLNPQVIMVRAGIMTEERKKFTKEYPSLFGNLNMQVMKRADDVATQVTYYLFRNESKNHIPNILKRSWAGRMERFSRYELYKYRNHGIGLIDTVRICHANNKDINELIRTGTIEMDIQQKTWETLRAGGMSWQEIYDTLDRFPHMALLRNLRGIFSEIEDGEKQDEILSDLKKGVKNGKQFPFRYMSARKAVLSCEDVHNRMKVVDTLEDCMDISVENLPHLAGNNAFLSDNSGSAWGQCNSEYGSVTVAEIGNLSCVIGAVCSDEGTVIKFGDKMKKYPISKRTGILKQAQDISDTRCSDVGGGTEGGVWLFFKEAIEKGIHYDNIFIYSDMQAGHGGLYGTDKQFQEYGKLGYNTKNGRYISVAKLIDAYRKKVNPKVNVFCIQTAGYNNVLVPENGYRTSILYGWTGKELVYADMVNKFWDEKDKQNQK